MEFTKEINARAKEIREEAAKRFGGVASDYNWNKAVSLACEGFEFAESEQPTAEKISSDDIPDYIWQELITDREIKKTSIPLLVEWIEKKGFVAFRQEGDNLDYMYLTKEKESEDLLTVKKYACMISTMDFIAGMSSALVRFY